ncbi:hypothetical protein KQI82_08545 [Oscillibacter sp. MSJ-2]|uniref:Aspartate/glutamate racemase family protein n=1 Tax=Dysosmobacter acutus TaxID=2841504 RepID=A0ABS6F9J6_9FIRM|nr:hypothetical protein [Dysosmobacter acutus]MBU5626954.1 hypothetical protein [Dysosmobacter acutus]
MTIMRGGTASQGTPIGILMADTVSARIPGDVGNGFTYDFPVRFYTVKGATAERISKGVDPELADALLDGARFLEAEGCQAITTSCGSLIAFQDQLASAVQIPVFTSSLLQASFAAQIIQPHKKIGILTDSARSLDPRYCTGYGLTKERIAIQGLEDTKAFYPAFYSGTDRYVYEEVEADVLWAAGKLIREHPDIGAIVCEGADLAPFSPAVNRMTGLPTFDIVTLIRLVASGILRGMTSPFQNRLNGGDTGVPPSWGRPPMDSEEAGKGGCV